MREKYSCRHFQQLNKFVGLAAIVWGVALLITKALVEWVGVDYRVAWGFVLLSTLFYGYALQSVLVFKAKLKLVVFVKYSLALGFVSLLNWCFVIFLVEILYLQYLLAVVLSTIIFLLVKFGFYKYWVFN